MGPFLVPRVQDKTMPPLNKTKNLLMVRRSSPGMSFYVVLKRERDQTVCPRKLQLLLESRLSEAITEHGYLLLYSQPTN